MAYELKSDDTFWRSEDGVYLGNNTWTSAEFAEWQMIPNTPLEIIGIRLKYQYQGYPDPYSEGIAGITNTGGRVYVEVSELGSDIEIEILPPPNEHFVSIEAGFYFTTYYATISNIKDIYVDARPSQSRLYKLDSFELQTVYVPDTYSNPPQINRPPSSGQPYNPKASFYKKGYPPSSYGSDTVSRPTGGSRNNTNTNNRPPNNNVNLFVGDLSDQDIERLLKWMHENGVSGIQY